MADPHAAALRKISCRLLPFLFVLYVVAWLDRVNVGFAALQMNAALKFSEAAFGFGSGIFFLGYCLFEVPSNLILARVGARRWISRIMITWGLISAGMMFVRTPAEFYLLRFLLGAAEAGFFPGVIFYLSLWYPAAQRARDRSFYDGGAGDRIGRWPAVGFAPVDEWGCRVGRVAMALPGGRSAGNYSWHPGALFPH